MATIIQLNSQIASTNILSHCQASPSTVIERNTAVPAPPFTSSAIDPANNIDNKETIYSWVHSSIIDKAIENILSPLGYQDLMLQKDLFCLLIWPQARFISMAQLY